MAENSTDVRGPNGTPGSKNGTPGAPNDPPEVAQTGDLRGPNGTPVRYTIEVDYQSKLFSIPSEEPKTTLADEIRASAPHLKEYERKLEGEELKDKNTGGFLASIKPLSLILRACALGGTATIVYLAIRHKRALDGRQARWSVCSDAHLAKFHSTRKQYQVAVPKLKAAGLVETKSRGRGKRPLVRLQGEK